MFGLYQPMLNLLDLNQEAVNFQTSYCLHVSNAVDAAYIESVMNKDSDLYRR